MRIFVLALVVLIILIFPNHSVVADPINQFDYYYKNWNEKIKLASQFLDEAEKELKSGNEAQACIKQRKAAKYGIEATQSLIKAFEESKSTNDLSDIQSGLKKWEELRDFC